MSPVGVRAHLLPVHLKPLPDELLSSWLIRLAHAHGQKTQSFCANLFGRDKTVWNRDIDKLAPTWLLESLADATATSIEAVNRTTLRAYEGVLYEHLQPNGNTRWILPLGIYHRMHRHLGLLYCPGCLAEDHSPYFRRSWRLACSIVCTKHNSWLRDSCPKCGSPVVPHRADMQSKEYFPYAAQFVHCWLCGYDLRKAPSVLVADHSLLWLQRKMDAALCAGYTFWDGNPSMYSLVFFDGVRALIAGLTSGRTIERLEFAQGCIEMNSYALSRSGFEFAKLGDRKYLFVWLSMLLQDWPKRLQALIHDSRLRYADLKGDSNSRPYWIESVIKHAAAGGFAAISDDEVLSITFAVEKQYGQFSLGKARILSGRDMGNHVAKRFPVTDDIYEDLLTAIDHQIAGTLNERKRVSLIRDKIMFAAGRVLGLSEEGLCQLTLGQLRRLVTEIEQPIFFEVAQSRSQVRAWVEWYWNVIRKPSSAPNIFISLNTGRVLTHHAVSSRFRQTIVAANMDRAIPSYSSWSLIGSHI